MLPRLTEEQLERLLVVASEEFGARGESGAAIRRIANAAGISVGVIYKYYADKDALFEACIERSVSYIGAVFQKVERSAEGLDDLVRRMIREVFRFSEEHPEVIRMYHQVTLTTDPEEAMRLAQIIERPSGDHYRSAIAQIYRDAGVEPKHEPEVLAFLFDNILMALQFMISSPYYRARGEIYCGEKSMQEEILADALIDFIHHGLFAANGERSA